MPGLELSLGLGLEATSFVIPGPTDIDVTWEAGFEAGAIPESTAADTFVATVSGDYDSVILLDDAGGQLQLVGSQLRVDTLGSPAFDEFTLRGTLNGIDYDETFAFAIVADVIDPPTNPPPEGEIDPDPGFENPPEVIDVDDEVVIKGNKKGARAGKFIYDVGPIQAHTIYTLRYDPDFSLLANDGVTAFVGFGLKDGQDFHLAGLKGDGATGLNAYRIHGTQWNNASGHTDTDGGAVAHGTQAGPNWLRLQTSPDGSTYTLSTSSDGSAWTEEFTDVVPSPNDDAVDDYAQFGIAVYLEAADAGSFFVGIELWTSVLAPVGEIVDFQTHNSAGSIDHTFSTVDFGEEDPSRVIVVAYSWARNSDTGTLTTLGITIGGVAAKLAGRTGALDFGTEIWYASVPTGASGSVAIDGDGNTIHFRAIEVHRLVGVDPHPLWSAANEDLSDIELLADEGGHAVAAVTNQTDTTIPTLTGITNTGSVSVGAKHGARFGAEDIVLDETLVIGSNLGGASAAGKAAASWPPLDPNRRIVHRSSSLSNGTGITFNNVNFGEEAADRVIAIALTWSLSADSGLLAITGMTIGGVTATRAREGSGGSAQLNAEIWYATVPTGESGSVVITGSGNSATAWQIVAARMVGLAATPHATAGNESTTDLSLATENGGFALAVVHNQQSTTIPTLTGIARTVGSAIDSRHASRVGFEETDGSTLTIGSNLGAANQACKVAVSWGPA